MELSLSTFKDATKLDPDIEFGGSLAWLHQLAWQCENPSRFFRSHQVQRDADSAEAQVPAKITTLGWEKEPVARQGAHAGSELVPFLLRRKFGVSSIYVREDYGGMLQEIIDVAVNGLSERTSAITVNTDNQVYNPFTMPMSVPAATAGAIVMGNPGIGKSTFLIYILVLRLFAGQTTVIQWSSDVFYVLNSEGVFCVPCSIPAVDRLESYVPRGTWFLFDSNRFLEDVPESFVMLCKAYSCFLLQAASPRKRHVRWTKKVNAQKFWMAPWSLGELIAGRDVQLWLSSRRPTELQLATFCEQFGNSANAAYVNAACSSFYKFLVEDVTSVNSINNGLTAMMWDDATSDGLVVARPDPANRLDYSLNISTHYLIDKILELHGHSDRQAALRLYWSFVIDSSSRANAGYPLEKAFLEQFPRGGQWRITKMKKKETGENIEWNYVKGSSWQYLRLGYLDKVVEVSDRHVDAPAYAFYLVSRELFPAGKVELQNGIFIPKTGKQTPCNSFVYDDQQKKAVLFQMTVSPSHDVSLADLNWLPEEQTPWIDVVVVTCPIKYNGAKEVTMDLKNSGRIHNVYHLELSPL